MESTLGKLVRAGRESSKSRVINGFVYLFLFWPGSQAIRSKPAYARQLTSRRGTPGGDEGELKGDSGTECLPQHNSGQDLAGSPRIRTLEIAGLGRLLL